MIHRSRTLPVTVINSVVNCDPRRHDTSMRATCNIVNTPAAALILFMLPLSSISATYITVVARVMPGITRYGAHPALLLALALEIV